MGLKLYFNYIVKYVTKAPCWSSVGGYVIKASAKALVHGSYGEDEKR